MSRSVHDIFEQLCEVAKTERDAKLSELCGDDQKLRSEVVSLLDAHDSAQGFLDEPTIGTDALPPTAAAPISEGPGEVIDRYKLLEKIGEGGFGAVYMAQQNEPVKRRVALKIIKLGMDTHQVVARFEAERQALALMDHPNIARVIDGGSTKTGRPYFVMELVRGDPITAFCDRQKLSLRDRLELFRQVCHAVEHAHQKGIIHRDIKPSNVLVTTIDDKPIVKVIDFGIAKATTSQLTDKTLFTEFRQLIGTPQYMSPEQAERTAADIDTRTDIYSLGVLLYEMLTGRTPLDPKRLNSAAWGELQRMIVEDEPSKPSVMVSTSIANEISDVAARRDIEPSRFGQMLRGDLDWIVLKAIDKDRSRRYGTASQFADDLDRYLNDLPVEATPPSRAYQVRKYVRRNRGILAAVAAVFLALIGGLIATSVSATWAMTQKRQADAARSRAEMQQQRALKALERAEVGERAARRAATAAGASLLLPESEARRLAESWEREIATQRADGENSETEIVRNEAQYVAWFASWLLRNERAEEADALIDGCFDRVKRVLGISDPVFLALSNSRVQVNVTIGGSAEKTADGYVDVIQSMEAIHGPQQTLELLPEFASALAAVDRHDDAAAQIRKYLSGIEGNEATLSPIHMTRLGLSIDGLTNWGRSHPELYRQLKAVRETGAPKSVDPSVQSDPELARDLKTLQGRWRNKQWKSGKLVEHMVVTFDGQNSTTEWLDEDENVIRGRSLEFELSRSGGVKVYTAFAGGMKSSGGAFIYQLKPNRFFLVSGMLANRQSLPETEMRIFYRIKENDVAE